MKKNKINFKAANPDIFSIDQLALIWPNVEKHLLADRHQYDPVYKIIETYVQKHNLVIGGTMGVNLLLNRPRSLDDFVYELYTETSFKDANNLANAIAEEIGEWPITMDTVIPYQRYKITVDNRILCWIIDLGAERERGEESKKDGKGRGEESKKDGKGRGEESKKDGKGRGEESKKDGKSEKGKVSPLKVIEPIRSKSGMLVLSPEMQLIDLYRNLSNPALAGKWEKALQDENKLFQFLRKDVNMEGGAAITFAMRNAIQKELLDKFAQKNANIAVIGEYALFLITEVPMETLILQIISTRDINEDFAEIEKIVRHITPAPLTKQTRSLHIMQDFRLRRTAIRLGDVAAGEQKEIMYIYNSANYDLIPVNRLFASSSFIQVGNPFVVLRFLLIDYWMLLWVLESGNVDAGYARKRLDVIRNKLLSFRSKLSHENISTVRETNVPSLLIFQPESSDYIGKYENEEIYRKSKQVESAHFYPYSPAEYFEKNNHYRKLS